MPETDPQPESVTPPNPAATTQLETDEALLAELDRAQQETEAESEKRVEAERREGELQAEADDLKMKGRLRDRTKELGIKHYGRFSEVYDLLKKEPGFNLEPRTGVVYIDGRKVTEDEMLTEFFQRHANWRDRNESEYRKEKAMRDAPQSKEELRTWQAKTDFISRYGLDAWTELPLKATPKVSTSVMTDKQYYALPLAKKTEIIAKIGEAGVAEILQRKG
ncbi:MAG: hypothetical protein H0X25_12505 [Acidobacteriales bacterium]|nr:hypothetical protein [Terriglobales bacterium]